MFSGKHKNGETLESEVPEGVEHDTEGPVPKRGAGFCVLCAASLGPAPFCQAWINTSVGNNVFFFFTVFTSRDSKIGHSEPVNCSQLCVNH